MNRALRRYYAERAKRRVLWLYPTYNEYMQLIPNDDPRAVGMRARTRKLCSCPGCGHRRYWEGPPVQERRAVPP